MAKKKEKKRKKIGSLRNIKTPDVDSLFTQAMRLHQDGFIDQAILLYQKILRVSPKNSAVYNLLGLAFHARGSSDKALSLLSKATILSPKTAKYHYDYGVVAQNFGKDEEAISAYRLVLDLEPHNGAAWENLGVALSDSGYNREAISSFEKALQLDPNSVLALTNLSTLRRWQGQHQQALDLLNHALFIDPANVSAHMKKAEILLSHGSFKQGWDQYAWRLIGAGRPSQDIVRFVPLPKWDGQPLEGKTLLIYTEQGIGDEVMFASCLVDLLNQKIDCHFLCDPRMVSAFKRSFPKLKVSPNISGDWGLSSERSKADYRLPIGDLPRFFRLSSKEFLQKKGYLKSDNNLSVYWRKRLKSISPGLKVGISWRGGRQKYTQRARSIELAQFAPLLSLPGITFINLQYGDCKNDLSTLPEPLLSKIISLDEIDPLVDLENFLAVIANLDLVITVDNSTVHFSGALGIPTWLLLPALSDWRWPVEGSESRWYPSVQLFRQKYDERESWAPVIDRVVAEASILNPELRDIVLEEKVSGLVSGGDNFYFEGRKALLLNDTSFWSHWGCTGTSLAIRKELRKRGWAVRGVPIHYLRSLRPVPDNFRLWNSELFNSFKSTYRELCVSLEKADIVVVNGEGSLHGRSSLSIILLYLMFIAKNHYGKRVHVINHSCYPDGQKDPSGSQLEELYQSVYSQLDHVSIREPVSKSLLERLGIMATQSFDCLPLFIEQVRGQIQRDGSNDIVFSGSVAWDSEMFREVSQLVAEFSNGKCRFLYGANAYPAGDDIAFIQQFQNRFPGSVELIYARSEIEWLSTIASAKLLISGRFHHSIAAACLNTPFIVMNSNTPKISGLMQILELDCYIDCKGSEAENELKELTQHFLINPEQGFLPELNHQKLLSLAGSNFTDLSLY